MRKFLFLCAIFFASIQLQAQDSASIPKLKIQVDSIQRRLDDGNYTRIPKQDFEKLLKTSVESTVSDSIKSWIGFLATMIGLVGVFIAAYFKTQIRTQVDESIKNELLTVNARIDTQNTKSKEENDRQDKKLAELTERIDNLLSNQTKFINDSASTIDKKIKSILSFAWDDIAEAKIRLAKEKEYNGKELIQEIKSFIENKEIEIRSEKRIALIEALMRCYYMTPDDNEQEKYKNMIQLLRKYETDYELLPETYANAAIALSNSYDQYGIKADRDTCIESCDKSVVNNKDYGEPSAIKLEVFMMDYKKAFDDEERAEAVDNIKRTFNAIENNKSKALCVQIIDRLDRDSATVPSLREYNTELEKMFPDNLIDIKERVSSDVLSHPDYFKEEWQTKLVENILQNHLLQSPDIQGNWTCVKVIDSGTELDPKTNFELLAIQGYAYTLVSNKIKEKGLLHLLPYSKIMGINFYKLEKELLALIVRNIFKLENGQLVICFNYASDKRPEEFTSTQQNQFVLAYYSKNGNTKSDLKIDEKQAPLSIPQPLTDAG